MGRTTGSLGNENIEPGVDAIKIADGSVTNTEFQYINTVTSNVQDQLDTNVTAIGLNTSHRTTNDGSDHSFID